MADFSSADPESLYSPLILNPVYGYQAVNVESQSVFALASLLDAALIQVRKSILFLAVAR